MAFWLDAPEGWLFGDPIPEGYEDSVINSANLEAFAQYIIDQIKPLLETMDGYPARGDMSWPRFWIGWTDPTTSMYPSDVWITIPEPA